jgi:putative intracellular protease/amidase
VSARVLVPVPSRDFDPSEVAVSWRVLREAGCEILFATPDGARAHADPIMLSGEGLDPWGVVPGLRRVKLIGLALRANRVARRDYATLERDPGFVQPIAYTAIAPDTYDALLLPGGHAQGMRPYLESAVLQRVVADAFARELPVGAICHGVLLAARSIAPATGRSVLHGRRTTALTWALERAAWNATRWLGRWWDRDYYRTYRETAGEPEGYWSVEAEVTRALARPQDFCDVPAQAPHNFRKSSGLYRDSLDDARPAFVVQDRNYLSARWPGDVHTFARRFADLCGAAGHPADVRPTRAAS